MCIDSYKDKVQIIGGGIIGLSIGWQLLRANIPTVLFDGKRKKASKVAAGMLSPYSESLFAHFSILEIGEKSLSLFPSFLKELKEDTKTTPILYKTGTLIVGIDHYDAQWIDRAYRLNKIHQGKADLLTGSEARKKETLLSPRVNYALYLPEEYQIDAKALYKQVKKAFLHRGGKIISTLLPTIPQEGVVIVATGAYSAKLGLPIEPIKGQIATMQTSYPLRHMIRSPRIYVAPSGEKTIRIGATEEEVGFQLQITGEGMRTLLENSFEILPAIDHMSLLSIDVGLRPTTRSGLPLIGEGNRKGLFYATGHGRHGILLTPYTAYLMKEKICTYYSMENEKK